MIPAALGAQRVHPGRQTVTVTGDGCLLMSAMELSTAAREGLPVKFFILDDPNEFVAPGKWLLRVTVNPDFPCTQFDIDHGHRFVKRIASSGVDEKGKPLNVKGICASAATGRLYVSDLKTLICFDLKTDRILWEKEYEGGCDRMSITPDGKTLYVPTLEKDHWNIIDGKTGDLVSRIETKSRAHNTVVSLDGTRMYLAPMGSPKRVTVVDTATHKKVGEVRFGNVVRHALRG